ncbi:carboxymuconolactone decarboxylase family protein [Bosea caraganae]|uniref:Carboxymuconolactone decarboxylase family protein n=1 Tax=Bosea caraganae TaxID=2763117 RepID=A0A370LCI8_9HYPH|nr:carboxymuconolactone decarboxylase family protein [Bosea caraganae]RDJ27594.1 carboxymuconolactone decarboxylase family protein [Bosea caraganae]RDJ29608.1 carboxymuconolactone decarboxylase family protein [Bosea caraganae]
MSKRLNPYTAAPDSIKPLIALEASLKESGLEHSLIHLVKMRASQLNGCAYCLHMHSAEAIKDGETPARLFLLDAWHESQLYTPRERAALAWTESLTLISQTHAPDEDYEEAREHFSEEELVKLTLLIGTINTWNRIAIGFRSHHPNDRPRG